jgi:hypothetical protein
MAVSVGVVWQSQHHFRRKLDQKRPQGTGVFGLNFIVRLLSLQRVTTR